MSTWFDTRALAACLRTKRGNRGLREVASEIRTVSIATLSRVERGAVPDLETFLRLCDWLQMPTSTFLRSNVASHNEIVHLIEQALTEDGILAPHVIQAFVALIRAVHSPHNPK